MTVTAARRSGPRRFEERIDRKTGEKYLAVFRRGAALTTDPLLNKGTCFTLDERDELDLRGLMPPAVCAPAEQEARAYDNFLRAADDVSKYLFLTALHRQGKWIKRQG